MEIPQPRLQSVFTLTPQSFSQKALEVFHYQSAHCLVYKNFLRALDIHSHTVKELHHIPFLPVELFKSQKIVSGTQNTEFYFESSGTTDERKSKHFVSDLSVYDMSIKVCFEKFYGNISDYCFVALLPSYLERNNASLVYMCNFLMQQSGHKHNGFYLHEYEKLHSVLLQNEEEKQKTIFIGVSFALLDFAESYGRPLQHTLIMETGGMKGRREEITRKELHDELRKAFSVSHIHSEYGMTELLSQAYARHDGYFSAPPWMQVLIRDVEDPLEILPAGKTGCINIVDLANLHTCSFLATQDLGKCYTDGTFEVLGRYDASDVRGCNLMVD